MNAGLLKTSLVNFPGRVAAAVFLPGCNLRCPFCHNAELASASVVSGPKNPEREENEYPSLEEIYAHLDRRASVLGGLAISGGEPLISPALTDLIRKAKSLGLAVKIDTNGTLPDRLKSILGSEETRPDMIAIDVKTSPARYGELTTEPGAGAMAGESLLRSLAILAQAPSTVRIEYRTVLVPGLVQETEIREIAALLPGDADWELARFVPGNCLSPAMNRVDPYGPTETARLVSLAKTLVPGARIR
jgi:pyruvate formate lyase activating enzyme